MTSTQGPATAATPKDRGDGRGFSVRPPRDKGPLRQRLDAEAVPLKALTVLSSQRDPFRVDTEANHRDAAWLTEQIDQRVPTGQTIHLRAFHYRLPGLRLPNGSEYVNSDDHWTWMSEKAAKAARWLGYIPFGRIHDARNDQPEIIYNEPAEPRPYIHLGGVEVDLPDEIDEPTVGLLGAIPQQPFKLVIYGEKSSLKPVLAPVAKRYGADLYLPTGEISDTLMHTMASVAAYDGRPLVVFTWSDCDPAGWQMPISIGRKLQAMQTLLFPNLEFRVYRLGLMPAHVAEYGLPSTPLKSTESRADDWTEAMQVDQTEVDALIALHAGAVESITEKALDHFYDWRLAYRTDLAKAQWAERAQAQLTDVIGAERLLAFRHEAEHKLESMRSEIEAINEALQLDASDLELPEFVMPEAEIPEPPLNEPLVDSSWTFADQCEALIASKRYQR